MSKDDFNPNSIFKMSDEDHNKSLKQEDKTVTKIIKHKVFNSDTGAYEKTDNIEYNKEELIDNKESADNEPDIVKDGKCSCENKRDNVQYIPEREYLSKRKRITFELTGGSYSLPVIDVKLCTYGVCIILPAGNMDVTFSPNPGATLGLVYNNKTYNCFSPGTAFNIPELNIMILTLVLSDTKNEQE